MISNLCYAQPSPKFQVTGSHMLEHQLPGWAPANAAAETSRSICSFRCNMKHQPEKCHIWKKHISNKLILPFFWVNIFLKSLSVKSIWKYHTELLHSNACTSTWNAAESMILHLPQKISSMSFNRIKAGSQCLGVRGPLWGSWVFVFTFWSSSLCNLMW